MNTPSSSSATSAGTAPATPDFPHGLDPKRLFEAVAAPTEGAPGGPLHAAPNLDEVATAFPQLEILALLGAGGMGAVFKARQPSLDRFVALKILPAGLQESDPAFAERFAREGRLLARLNHPNIVAVHDFGRAGPFFYLLMEYVDGVNLRQAMRANRFTPDQALALVPRICEALQFAHDEGVLHRDIKPENILLDARGRVKLADFGIAKLAGTADPSVSAATSVDPGLTQAGAALGTPSYMAPEQRQHPGAVDHRADIYSLGVVFYELLTGELPTGKFAPPSATAAVDARIDTIVQRALEKDRALRQQSAREMKTQVEDVTLGAPRPAGNSAPQNPATPPAASPGVGARDTRPSGKAVTGAVLTGLSLLFAAAVPLIAWVIQRASPGHGASPSYAVFSVVLFAGGSALLLGLVGTLLGWLGLGDVRASRGATGGRRLGMFAALTWPLILAGALEAMVLGRVVLGLFRDSAAGPVVLVLWLVAFGATCVAVTRSTRRWLNPGAMPATAPASNSRTTAWSTVGCIVAAIVAALLIPLLGVVGYLSLWHSTSPRVHGPAPSISRSPAAEAPRPTVSTAPEAPAPPEAPTPPQ